MSGNDVVWYLRLAEEDVGPIRILTAEGRIFGSTAGALEARLTGAELRGRRALIVDLTGVDYINSRGLEILTDAAGRAVSTRCELIVCGLSAGVRTVFDLSGASAALIIEPSREAALRRIESTRGPKGPI